MLVSKVIPAALSCTMLRLLPPCTEEVPQRLLIAICPAFIPMAAV